MCLILWPVARSRSYFKYCSNNGQFGERYACQPACLYCNLTVVLPTAGPTQGKEELQLSGLIGTASHPDNWIFLWEKAIMAVWSSAVTISSMYLRLKPLRAGRSGDRIPVGGEIFHTCPDRPWGPPASYTKGTGSFPGVKRPRCGVDHPTPSSAEVKERVELYLYFPSWPSWPVLGWTLPFTLLPENNGFKIWKSMYHNSG